MELGVGFFNDWVAEAFFTILHKIYRLFNYDHA